MAKIKGSNSDDTINGTSGNDKITAKDGDDLVEGGDGKDKIDGGDGDDSLYGGDGRDDLKGGSGDDLLDGGDDDDKLDGGDGADTLLGGAGDDKLKGGEGDDSLDGGDGDDRLEGQSGNDTLLGGAGDDEIYGDSASGSGKGSGSGGNVVSFDDYLDGGAGNDIMVGGQGEDTVLGGDGNDIIYGDQAHGSGSGSGSGYHHGSGSGSGSGHHHGSGSGSGSGHHHGSGSGSGSGAHCGSGSGSGSGHKKGSGSGSGDTGFADYLDGGAGDDILYAGGGDDEAVYVAAENVGATDFYSGGSGVDKLTLVLTSDEWFNPDLQADIAAYLQFLADNTGSSGEANGAEFTFTAFNLTVTQFEDLCVIVDGQELNPADELVDAIDDAVGVNEDDGAVLFGSVLANDDVPDLAYSVALISGPAEGVLTFNPGTPGSPDGSFSFDPDGDFEDLAVGETRDVTFVYEVTDADGDTDQATVTITVTGANDAPTLAIGTGDAVEDGPSIDVDLSALGDDIDSDDDGTTLSYAITGAVSEGSASISGTTLTFDPGSDFQDLALNETRDVVIQVTATDAHGATAVNDVTVTVTGTNDAPVALADVNGSDAVTEAGDGVAGDASATGNVLDNDDDADTSDTLAVSGVAAGDQTGSVTPLTTGVGASVLGVYGSLVLAADGVWTYTLDDSDPDTNALPDGASVTDVFTYVADDGNGGQDRATLTISITGSNDAPVVAAIDAGTVGEDDAVQVINLLAGQSDPDTGAVLTAENIVVTDDLGAAVAFTDNGDGTIDIDPAQYDALNTGENRTLTVAYDVDDGLAATANTATLVIEGDTDNEAPVANDDVLGLAVEGEFLVNVETNSGQTKPDVVVLSDGRIVFVWQSNDHVEDPHGGGIKARIFDADGTEAVGEFLVNEETHSTQSDAEVIELANGQFLVTWSSLDGSNDPSGYGIKAKIYNSDGSVEVSELLVNDETSSSQLLSNSAVLSSGQFVVVWMSEDGLSDTSSYGIKARVFNADGTEAVAEFLVNEETAGYQFEPEVTVLSNDQFVVTWTSPDGVHDPSQYGVKARIFNADGTEAVAEFLVNTETDVYQGEPEIAALAGGQFLVTWISSDGLDDTSGYGVKAKIFNSDGTEAVAEFLVNDEVLNHQRKPVAATLSNGQIALAWYSFDGAEDSSSSGIKACVIASNGALVVAEFLVNEETFSDQNDPEISALSGGRFIVTWHSSDGVDDTSNTGIKARIFNADGTEAGGALTDENTAHTIAAADLLANDTDADGDTLTITAVSATSALGATVILNGDGSVTYDPTTSATLDALAQGETLEDSFTYTITDGNGGFDTATVTMVVAGVNVAPVLTTTTAGTDEDVAVSVAVLAGASDPDGDPLSIDGFTQGANGTVTLDDQGDTDPTNDVLVYTPDADFTGSDSFDYTVVDGQGGSTTETVTVTVSAQNHAPVIDEPASDLTGSVSEPAELVAGVDSDSDGINDTNDNAPFIANTDQADADGDGIGDVVDPYPSIPSGPMDSLGTIHFTDTDVTETQTATASFHGSTDDLNGMNSATLAGLFSVVANSSPVSAAGTVDWTFSADPALFDYLAEGQTIELRYEVEVEDIRGATDSVIVTISVTGSNDAPVLTTTTAGTDEDTSVAVAVLAGASDPEGDPLSINGFTQGTNGTVVLDDQGDTDPTNDVLVYTPDADFTGSDSFDYTVVDDQGGSTTETVTVTVAAQNDAPIGGLATVSATEDDLAVTLDVLAAASDADGDTIELSNFSQPLHGTVIRDDNGTVGDLSDDRLIYTPDANFSGTDSIGYTLSDGQGGVSSWVVDVAVDAVADMPTVTLASVASTVTEFIEQPLADLSLSGTYGSVVASLSSGGWAAGISNGAGNANLLIGDDTGVLHSIALVSHRGYVGTPTSITGLANGDFAVAWYAPYPYEVSGDRSSGDTYIQVFAADGTARTSALHLSADLAAERIHGVEAFDDGTFLLTWEDGINAIHGQVYGPDLTPLGSEFDLTGVIPEGTMYRAIETLPDGSFFMVWEGDRGVTPTINQPLYGRIFDSDGTALSATVQLGHDLSASQYAPAVTRLDDGNLVVVWTEAVGTTSNFVMYAQILDSNGQATLGGAFAVEATSSGYPIISATVESTSDGGFVIIRTDNSTSSGPGSDIVAQYYAADGTPMGSEVVVNDTTTGDQTLSAFHTYEPSAVLSDGRIVTIWSDPSTGAMLGFLGVVSTSDGTEDQPMPVDLTASLSDTDGSETLQITLSGFPAGATFNLGSASGADWVIDNAQAEDLSTLVMTPPADWHGSFTMTVTAVATETSNGDTSGTTVSAEFTISPAPDAPVAVDDSITTDEGIAVSIDVLDNDTDVDGDTLEIVGFSQGSNGSVLLETFGDTDPANDVLVYTPASGFDGTDTFTYSVSDGNGGTDTATVEVTVANVPQSATVEFTGINGAEDWAEDGFIFASNGGHTDNNNSLMFHDSSDGLLDNDFYISRSDGGSFSLVELDVLQTAGGVTLIANDGQTVSIGAGTSGTVAVGFTDVTSILIEVPGSPNFGLTDLDNFDFLY